jgi:hypothetical protein
MEDAWGGELIPDFDADLPTADEVLGVMRFDLGVEDGYTVTEAI